MKKPKSIFIILYREYIGILFPIPCHNLNLEIYTSKASNYITTSLYAPGFKSNLFIFVYIAIFNEPLSDFPINHHTTSGILVFRPHHFLFFNQQTGSCANFQFKLIYFTLKNKFSQLILILLDGSSVRQVLCAWEGHEKILPQTGIKPTTFRSSVMYSTNVHLNNMFEKFTEFRVNIAQYFNAGRIKVFPSFKLLLRY